MDRFTVATLALLLGACGAKSGIDTPAPCESAAECPRVPFCEATSFCLDGYCAVGPAPTCSDGLACTDDRCDPIAEVCVSTIRDDDADGFGDASCGGEDCDDADPGVRPDAAELCSGGRDEDCDGATDCSDPDCAGDPRCAGCEPEACTNGLDDDCDGLIDCADSDCATEPACCLAAEVVCTDAVDEDCDGLLDCLDDDCFGAPTCCTALPEVCNGLDDDCDGVADDGLRCYFLDGEPLAVVLTEECGRDWYSYGSPDIASANTEPEVRRPDAVALMVQEAPGCGASVAVIADATNDGDGGRLEASFTITPASAGGVLVSDDGRECSYDSRTGIGSCSWRWEPCCTDGVLLGEFERDFCVVFTVSSPSGVSELVALDGLGLTRPLRFGTPFEVCGQIRAAVP